MLFDGIRLVEGSEVQKLVIHTGTAFPPEPDEGELFYRTDALGKGLYVYQNLVWTRQINQFDSVDTLLDPTGVPAGTYKSVTVDETGRVTAGTNPSTLIGYGIIDAQPLDGDLTAIAAIVNPVGLLKKTDTNTWVLDTSTYLTGNQNITVSGDATGSGATSIPITLNTVNSNTGTFGTGYSVPAVTVNNKGLVTAITTAPIPEVTTSSSGLLTAADKTKLDSLQAGTNGTVTGVTSSAPLVASTGAVPHISMPVASVSVDGYLSSADWSTFNNKQPALGFTPENIANKNISGGYAGLNGSGKIAVSQLPSIVLTDTYVVNSEAAMLAQTAAEQGDIAVRTDINKTFILKAADYSQLSNWQELLSPTDAVSSVNGMTGAVTIPSYVLPVATASSLGGVKQGTNITIAGDGTISTATNLSQGVNSSTTVSVNSSSGGSALLSAATTALAGVLTAADKTKLDGISAGANNYSLPVATASTLGGVKQGTNITIAGDGTISSVTTINLASPGPIGNVTPGTGAFTTLSLQELASDVQMRSHALRFDQSGVRSWAVNADAGNLKFGSGDGLGNFAFGSSVSVNGSITSSTGLIDTSGSLSLFRAGNTSYLDWATGQTLILSTALSSGGAGRQYAAALSNNGFTVYGANPNRAVSLTSGEVTIRGETGGWSVRHGFAGSSGTERGGFGGYGTNDTLNYYYVGQDWNNYNLQIVPSVGVNVNGTFSVNAHTNLNGGVVKITQASGAQRILLGNQDSAGTNNPSIIQAANGEISIGNGTTWANDGGTFTQIANFKLQGLTITGHLTVNEDYIGTKVIRLRSDWAGSGPAVEVPTNHPIRFVINGTSHAEIDTAGNLGLGVTPSAWGNGASMQGSAWALSTLSGTDSAGLTTNARQTAYGGPGTNFVYRTSAAATHYAQHAGAHVWYTAPSGTAGNAISFTRAMALDASGNLGLGVTPSGTEKALIFPDTHSIKIALNGQVTGNYYAIEKRGNVIPGADASIKFVAGNTSAGEFVFASGGAHKAIIDAPGNFHVLGNIAVGAAGFGLHAWPAPALEFRNGAVSSLSGPFGQVNLTSNAFASGSSDIAYTTWRYSQGSAGDLGRAGKYSITGSTHYWHTASPGLAGDPINFDQVMSLDYNGRLSVTNGVDKLTTATGAVSVASSTAPAAGHVLTATSPSTASWQAPPNTGASVTVSATAPSSPSVGNLWYDNGTSGRGYVWDGTTWADFAPGAAGGVTVSATAPSSPATGDLWYDNGTTGRTYIWDGSGWVDSSPAGSGGGGGAGSGSQSWQNVIGSRALGSTYTNNTGSAITVAVQIYTPSGGWGDLYAIINGTINVPIAGMDTPGGSYPCAGTLIVPAGNTYAIFDGGGGSLNKWVELR